MKQTIDLKTIKIFDGSTEYFGADQRWFENAWHSKSGCGPTTAAMITMHMAAVFPGTCAPLFPYALPATKQDFTAHMNKIRPYVKPGPMGLKSTAKFAAGTAAFAKKAGVRLAPQVVSRSLSMVNAFGYIHKAVEHNYMPALLILVNPSKEISDFHWHWMAVTGVDAETKTVYVSTYGGEFELSFELVWHQQKPYEAGIVYFYPA